MRESIILLQFVNCEIIVTYQTTPNPPCPPNESSMYCLNDAYDFCTVGNLKISEHVEAVARVCCSSFGNSSLGITGNPNGGSLSAPVKNISISSSENGREFSA